MIKLIQSQISEGEVVLGLRCDKCWFRVAMATWPYLELKGGANHVTIYSKTPFRSAIDIEQVTSRNCNPTFRFTSHTLISCLTFVRGVVASLYIMGIISLLKSQGQHIATQINQDTKIGADKPSWDRITLQSKHHKQPHVTHNNQSQRWIIRHTKAQIPKLLKSRRSHTTLSSSLQLRTDQEIPTCQSVTVLLDQS